MPLSLEASVGVGGVTRPPPPPPYPGTLRQPQPPPPPYPQVPFEGAEPWADWLHRRPLLLQTPGAPAARRHDERALPPPFCVVCLFGARMLSLTD
ncbi:hypothetical protein EVAR_32638_1 [Eumeta japonica]|uniref:Uncharacterized protein n=1 Tax=Eumeta variegata TaxID=151549 RepID=A0A4C1WSQ1_EUMVA|nr:hypothetical protein EVAR_32638_1 [Eumeta japonica]